MRRKLMSTGLSIVAIMGLAACGNNNAPNAQNGTTTPSASSSISSTVVAAGTSYTAGTVISTQDFLNTYKAAQSNMKAVHAVSTTKVLSSTTSSASPSATSSASSSITFTNASVDSKMDKLTSTAKYDTKTVADKKTYETVQIGQNRWSFADGVWLAVPTAQDSTLTVFTSAELFSELSTSNTVNISKIQYVGKDGDNDKYVVTLKNSTGNSDITFEFNSDKYLVSLAGQMTTDNVPVYVTLNQSDFDKSQNITAPKTS